MSQNREEKMSKAKEMLVNGVKEIFESGRFDEYLKALSRFPSYSINNCVLIACQDPTATYVCGYKAWQRDFNRTVNKGEHGIMILAPVKGKIDVEEPVFDEHGNKVLKEDGTQKTEKVEKEVMSFRPVYVFDVKQTSGDPLPSLVSVLDERVENFEQLKEVLIKVSPVSVAFEAIEGEANGYYSPVTQMIVVKDTLPELQTIKTLIHEIAHASLGHGSKTDTWDRETKEVQAESVAFWVSHMLGLDTSEYSFGYISGWSKDKEATELMENLDLIKKTADTLSKSIEECLEIQQKKHESEALENADVVAEKNIRKKSR